MADWKSLRGVLEVVDVLEELEIPYHVGGSLASSVHQWYRLGHEVSDRQWNDILGVIRTQGDRLDRGYLRQWASELEVSDLLERALQAA